MSHLTSNLKYLRKESSHTQQSFADLLSVKRSLIGAYEEGRANPNYETLTAIARQFDVSIDALINTDLSKTGGKDVTGKGLRVLSITVNENDNENIELVPVKAAAGYLGGFGDPDYLKELPRFSLPFLPTGTYRAFEIKGDSMLPLQPGSIVVGEYVENWKEMKDGLTYIILTKDDGIVYKRVFNNIERNKSLILRSDNPSYPPYDINVNEIMEVWKAKVFISMAGIQPAVHSTGATAVDPSLMEIITKLQTEVDGLKKGK